MEALRQGLIDLLQLPSHATEEDIFSAVADLMDKHNNLLTSHAEVLALKMDIEQQRIDAIAILRKASVLHAETKRNTSGG